MPINYGNGGSSYEAERLNDGLGNIVTAADAKDAVTKKHTQGTDQALDTGGANEVTAANAADAVSKAHTQGTDQGLDTGGPNASTAADVADAVSDKHTQGTDQGLDTGGANATTAAEVKGAVDESHVQGTDQGLDTGGVNASTAADVKDAVDKKHTQNSDTFLDEGNANEVTAANAADAVSKKHTQGTDQYLDEGGVNQSTAADVKAAVGASHVQGTDQYLDEGGVNQSTAADVKDAVTKAHTQGTDQGLDTGGGNAITAATIRGHVDSTANPHATDIDNLGAGTMLELDTTISDGAVSPQESNTIYVDGDQGNDGAPTAFGYATIAAALAVPPAAGDEVRVAPGTYTENITVPAGVLLHGPTATIVGSITVNDGSRVLIQRQTVATGTTGIALTGATACAKVEIVGLQEVQGTGVGYVNINSGAFLTVVICKQTIVNGYGGGATIAGGVILAINNVEISGTGVGIAGTDNTVVTGHVGRLTDGGAGTGILLLGTAECDISSETIDCGTAYNVPSTAELRLSCDDIVGTRTGLAKLCGNFMLPNGLAIATYVPADGSVVPVVEGDLLWDGNTGDYAVCTANVWQPLDLTHLSDFTHADIATNTGARHTQGTDQFLDEGGGNEVTAANAADAVTKKHDRSHALDDTSDHTVGAGIAGQVIGVVAGPALGWITPAAGGVANLQEAYDAAPGIITDATGDIAFSGTEGFTADMDKASSINVTSNNLTLKTTTSGTVDVDAAGALDLTSGAASTWEFTGGVDVTGTVEFQDDQILAFGDAAEATINYDEDGNDRLQFDGVAVELGSHLVFGDSATHNIGSLANDATDGYRPEHIYSNTDVVVGATTTITTDSLTTSGKLDMTIGAASDWAITGGIDLTGTVEFQDNAILAVGGGDDFHIIHDTTDTTLTSKTGDLVVDNTNATGTTVVQLGTDTAATAFEVQNNSGTALLKVDGAGTITPSGGSLPTMVSEDFPSTGVKDWQADGTGTEGDWVCTGSPTDFDTCEFDGSGVLDVALNNSSGSEKIVTFMLALTDYESLANTPALEVGMDLDWSGGTGDSYAGAGVANLADTEKVIAITKYNYTGVHTWSKGLAVYTTSAFNGAWGGVAGQRVTATRCTGAADVVGWDGTTRLQKRGVTNIHQVYDDAPYLQIVVNVQNGASIDVQISNVFASGLVPTP